MILNVVFYRCSGNRFLYCANLKSVALKENQQHLYTCSLKHGRHAIILSFESMQKAAQPSIQPSTRLFYLLIYRYVTQSFIWRNKDRYLLFCGINIWEDLNGRRVLISAPSIGHIADNITNSQDRFLAIQLNVASVLFISHLRQRFYASKLRQTFV